LALFLVLTGGVAWALAKNSVTAKHIRANAVGTSELKDDGATGADVSETTLGEVPSAARADHSSTADSAQIATTAQSAQTAETSNNATSAGIAQTAANAQLLDGRSASQLEGARAYGYFDDTLRRSKNVDAVSHPATGIYCIDPGAGIDASSAVLLVSSEFVGGTTGDSTDDVSIAEWRATPAGQCAGGTLTVVTFELDSNADSGGGEAGDNQGDVTVADQGFVFAIP
jgi:hypothetical protein